MSKLLYKNGAEVKRGDVIRWRCWDNDDFVTWTLTGLYKGDHVVYLGGGVDFGVGIGMCISLDEVILESEANDPCDVGIDYVCSCRDLARLVRNIPCGYF